MGIDEDQKMPVPDAHFCGTFYGVMHWSHHLEHPAKYPPSMYQQAALTDEDCSPENCESRPRIAL
jgi:hypothetical protein